MFGDALAADRDGRTTARLATQFGKSLTKTWRIKPWKGVISGKY